uniref:BPTI/Kunitz inhibitor domain-containing protein n=1 Tax=Panagrolaimus sp. ES5 TaxID=591445 RepID=A0AC34F5T8_9BILA
NANNFVSRAACAESCQEFVNPCGDGQPLASIDGEVTYCSPQNKNICPVGYYCHVGSGADSTVCCPGPVNPCLLSMEVGRGSSSLPRYYFNQFTRQCQQFIYSGRNGNANNFISSEACRQTCPEFNNPCSNGGMPFQPNNRAVFHCDSSTPCPHDYYCHHGIDSITTVCCPIISEAPPCELPALAGTGQSSVTRYYYNTQVGQCIPFIYSGLGGNQNNFVSMQDCINSCSMAQPYLSSSISCNGGNCQHPQPPPSYPSPFGLRMHKFVNQQPLNNMEGNENFLEHFIQNSKRRKVCPQGEALITQNGDPIRCNIHDIHPCPNRDYVCNLNAAGEAFCCPDPS